MKTTEGLVAALLLTLVCGCQSNTLSRPVALKLLKGREMPVSVRLVGSYHTTSSKPEDIGVRALESAGVLQCARNRSYPEETDCHLPGKPTAFGGLLEFAIGDWIASEVTGITNNDEKNTALAEVRYTFQINPTYANNRASVDALLGEERKVPQQDKTFTVSFQRFDDGWRVQGIQ